MKKKKKKAEEKNIAIGATGRMPFMYFLKAKDS